jgi:UPF0755 protein
MMRQFFTILRAILIPLILGLILLCGVASIFVFATTPEGLDPLDGVVLRVYLWRNDALVHSPHGTDPTLHRFEVAPGESANTIGVNLVTAGIIDNGSLFARYAQFHGLDDDIHPGIYYLSEAMTIPEILDELTDPVPRQIRITVRENMRLEEIAELIDNTDLIEFSGAEFMAVAGPGVVIPNNFRETYGIPASASLEGFLFPETYFLDLDATPIELRDLMLQTFQTSVTSQMVQDAQAQGRSMFEVVTLASIVEREAVLEMERPTIASVYLNRLREGQKLDADPTVQYQLANNRNDGEWWPNLTLSDYNNVQGPYNTYISTGLPPGPIVSPSLSSIRAVIYPADTPYFYFRASCNNDGSHLFSIDYDEHLSKAC